MVEFTQEHAAKLEQLINEAIGHAHLGSRTAFKSILAMKPLIDVALERIARDERKRASARDERRQINIDGRRAFDRLS